MINKYHGACLFCSLLVKAGEGRLYRMGSAVGPVHHGCYLERHPKVDNQSGSGGAAGKGSPSPVDDHPRGRK